MPKQSLRTRALAIMQQTLHRATALLAIHYVTDGIGENFDLDDPTLLSYLIARARFHAASGRRYLKKRNHRKSILQNVFEDDLRECEDG